jgi:hypothetical protein
MSSTNGHNGKRNGTPRKRRQRNYSDDEKASALVVLDFCKGNLSEASRRLEIPITTIKEWNDGRVNEQVTESRNEKKADLANSLEELAFTLIGKISGSEKVSGVDLGIVVDKMLLLRGEATTISKDVTHGSPEQRRARILELVKKAKVS